MAPGSLGDGQTDGIIEASALAQTVVETMREERFHVLPHPEVEEYVRRKGDNVDRWLLGMQRLRKRMTDIPEYIRTEPHVQTSVMRILANRGSCIEESATPC